MLVWYKEHGIHVFRLSSEMFPHMSNPEMFLMDQEEGMEYYKMQWAKPKLTEIGQLAKSLGIRLTFHPASSHTSPHKHPPIYIKRLTGHKGIFNQISDCGCDVFTFAVVS